MDIIKTLDNRGILQSIASKNEHDVTMTKLVELGLSEYSIYPQINWNSKSHSVKTIAKLINIGIGTLMFIDDQQFEREKVAFSVPEVECGERGWGEPAGGICPHRPEPDDVCDL